MCVEKVNILQDMKKIRRKFMFKLGDGREILVKGIQVSVVEKDFIQTTEGNKRNLRKIYTC